MRYEIINNIDKFARAHGLESFGPGCNVEEVEVAKDNLDWLLTHGFIKSYYPKVHVGDYVCDTKDVDMVYQLIKYNLGLGALLNCEDNCICKTITSGYKNPYVVKMLDDAVDLNDLNNAYGMTFRRR
jgi:hypothetical protein